MLSVITYEHFDPTKEVEVYWNLRLRKWSVRQKRIRTKKVVGHLDTLRLRDATFVVSQAGRKRTVETKHRTVHAWIRGIITDDLTLSALYPREGVTTVVYSPYEYEYFMSMTPWGAIHSSRYVSLGREKTDAAKFRPHVLAVI